MVLVQKLPFFQLFFLANIGQKKAFYDILEEKNAFLSYFLGQIGQENVFYDTLERKKALLGYGNMNFKILKNWHFSKVVNPWFLSKNGHFWHFFLANIGPENVFYVILEWKNAFLGYKNKNFKKSKNWHFSKGVNPWFWSKNGHFSNFFF